LKVFIHAMCPFLIADKQVLQSWQRIDMGSCFLK